MSSLLPAAPPPTEGTIDFRYYGGILWRSRVFVAGVAAAGLALGLLAAFAQTPEYRATTMVQIEPPTPAFMSVADAMSGNYWQNADFYNTQFKVLKSAALGVKTLDRLGLKDKAPFQEAPNPGALFMSHVGVEPVPESRLVLIHITHQDPAEAARWANGLGEVYIQDTVASRVEAARKAYEWLQERLAATQKAMRDAQDRLFQSYRSQDLFVPDGSTSAVSSSITRLSGDQIEAQARRITLEAALQQIAQLRAAGRSLDVVPQMAADPTIAALNGQIGAATAEMARLRQQYKEGHPEMQKLVLQIEEAQKAKQRQATQVIAALRAEYEQLQRRERELGQAIDSEKGEAASQSRKAAELDALRREAESAKGLYDVLLQKMNETDIASSVRTNNISIVEPALPPQRPIRPDKRRIAILGAVLGLMLGTAVVLGRDYFDNTIRDPDEVERFLHLDLLAAVPRYGQANVHFVTEAYQNLRTALIFARKDEGGQIVLVTGALPQDGKTTTAVNLGKLLASSGEKTVVVDFDLRRAQLHVKLGLKREPGATDYFVRHEPVDKLVRNTSVPNLYAITAGPLPPNPPAVLTRDTMPEFLASLRQHFHWVLLDSPPLASVTDALLLARHADLVLFVLQYNKTDKKLAKRHVAALRRVTPNLLGAVLNGVDVKASAYQYYYYYDQQQEPARAAGAPR